MMRDQKHGRFANRPYACRCLALVVALAFLLSSVAAVAQTSQQPDLGTLLQPGMTVWITDASGRESKVRIVDVSADLITTSVGEARRRYISSDVRRVRTRHSDAVVNGALIGAGVGAASGLLFCTLMEPWEFCRQDVSSMLKIGALGAGIGIGVDALIRGRRTIYEAPGRVHLEAAPIVGRGVRGFQLSLSF